MNFSTIKDVVNKLNEFANNHPQINEFVFGNPSRIQTNNREFVLLWLSLKPSKTNGPSGQYTFDMYILDVLEQDNSNELDVISDNMIIGNDVIANFFLDEQYHNGFEIDEENVIITPVADFDQHLTGLKFTITLYMKNNLDSCSIPQ